MSFFSLSPPGQQGLWYWELKRYNQSVSATYDIIQRLTICAIPRALLMLKSTLWLPIARCPLWIIVVKIMQRFLSCKHRYIFMSDLHYSCSIRTQCAHGRRRFRQNSTRYYWLLKPLWSSDSISNSRWHEWTYRGTTWLYRKWQCTLPSFIRWLYWGHSNARENQ